MLRYKMNNFHDAFNIDNNDINCNDKEQKNIKIEQKVFDRAKLPQNIQAS